MARNERLTRKELEQMKQRKTQVNQLVSELKGATAESQGVREAILRKAFVGEL